MDIVEHPVLIHYFPIAFFFEVAIAFTVGANQWWPNVDSQAFDRSCLCLNHVVVSIAIDNLVSILPAVCTNLCPTWRFGLIALVGMDSAVLNVTSCPV